jgi:hypothetical protein
VRCDAADPRWSPVLTGHSTLHGDVPVVVEDTRRGAPEPSTDEVQIPALLHFHLKAAPYVAGDEPGR